ncbi:MAG: hypothetical protein HGA45_20245 [Chloroflexales bacterium]|nr:hypothetical protein [Chloroflexales bacterium]
MQRATIANLTADTVVYRDLEPCDPTLPRLAALRARLGMAGGPPPRKRDLAYAQVIQALAHEAQAARGAPPLRALAVIGDTENDRLLAAHLRTLGELAAYGFIGEDRPVAPEALVWQDDTATATRWHLLGPWAAQLERQGVEWSHTALLVDIDKTLLGPRGCSDGAIDDARAEGALAVAASLMPSLNVPRFRRVYGELCRKEWHSFTLDNQDYVVATALLIGSGALDLEELRAQVEGGDPGGFAGALAATADLVPPGLAPLHAELRARVAEGDPTPFKAFRRAELTATLDRMADGRLTLCGALFNLCQSLADRGALCMAASDKPTESAMPSAEQAAAGVLPLHHTPAIVE